MVVLQVILDSKLLDLPPFLQQVPKLVVDRLVINHLWMLPLLLLSQHNLGPILEPIVLDQESLPRRVGWSLLGCLRRNTASQPLHLA